MTWQELVATSSHDYAFSCKNLATGKVVNYRENELVETASVIKLPILLCLFDAVQRGGLSLQKPVKVLKRQIGRNGSGLVQYFDLSQPIVLHNLMLMMMAISDNVATNVIIELLGRENINRYIKDNLGLRHTELITEFIDFTDELTPDKQPVGESTAQEITSVIERLLTGQILDEAFTKIALGLMKLPQTDYFCRQLPLVEFDVWANKTGSLMWQQYPEVVLNDCGYILAKDGTRYVFSMFMQGKVPKEDWRYEDAAYKLEYSHIAKAIFSELTANLET